MGSFQAGVSGYQLSLLPLPDGFVFPERILASKIKNFGLLMAIDEFIVPFYLGTWLALNR
jgi:hypothetical protein